MSSLALDVLKECFAAGCGAAIADGLFNPLDVLKVRLQLKRIAGTSTISDVVEEVFKESQRNYNSRLLALYEPGLNPTILRGLIYSGWRIGLYPTIAKTIEKEYGQWSPFLVKLTSGALTGSISSLICTPLDVVRVRFQQNASCYPTTLSAFKIIYKNEGFQALYSGSFPNVCRAAILSGTQLSIYQTSKQWLLLHGFFEKETPELHALSSFNSGIAAQCCVMPVDIIKTRFMSVHVKPAGLISCINSIYREKGISGFYRGLLVACLRQGPCILIQMPLIEQFRTLIGLDYL